MGKSRHITILSAGVLITVFAAVTFSVTNLGRYIPLVQAASEGAVEILSSTTGNYGGRITSTPAGIDCPGTCRANFPAGTQVTLTATPNPGRYLSGYGYRSGAFCQGQNNGETSYRGNPCVITVPSNGIDSTRVMFFNFDTNTIQVTRRGGGSGTVSSSPAAISCGAVCSATIPSRSNPNENPTYASNNYSSYALTATPAAGSIFAGWGSQNEGGSGCSSQSVRNTNSVCTITGAWDSPNANHAIAYFEKAPGGGANGVPRPAGPTGTPAPEAVPQPAETVSDLKEVLVNGKQLHNIDKVTVAQNELLKLEGKTTPNAVVKLFIFSEPQEATVTADAQGNWNYSLSGLAPGDHHIEFEVTDTAGKTGPRSQLMAFTVSPAAAGVAAQNIQNKAGPVYWLAAAGLALALISIGTVWWHHRHLSKHYPTPAKTGHKSADA